MSRWFWYLSQLKRTLWVRATLISLLAVAAALVSLIAGPWLPQGLSTEIGADAVDQILNIIASSMLAVTTFSLSTMIAAYSAATGNVTPRATKLLLEDTTTLNVLATFVGAFLYSLVAIITLSMGAYGERGRVVLFVVTIFVVVLIVVTLLRWIDYLRRLGRVGETTAQVETATEQAFRRRARHPHLGALPAPADGGAPKGARPVYPTKIGYVQHIAVDELDALAGERKVVLHVAVLPGSFVDPGRPLAHVEGEESEDEAKAVRTAFTVGEERTFSQDPRFGIIVMAEIASRALSPAVNDPGTAIDVLGRLVRIISLWSGSIEPDKPEYQNVRVPPVTIDEVFDDAFAPIARDGAALAEVQIRLQKALAALARSGDSRFRSSALRHSRQALARAEASLSLPEDRNRVQDAASTVA